MYQPLLLFVYFSFVFGDYSFENYTIVKDDGVIATKNLRQEHLSAEKSFTTDLSVQTLTVSDSKFQIWTPHFCDSFPNLLEISARECGIEEIQLESLDKCDTLKKLNFGSNKIKRIDANIFSRLTALETLSLSKNQLTFIPADALYGLPALETLDLSWNQLTTIAADTLDGLTALETLHLSGNQLTTIPSDALNGLLNLQRLYLSYNQLTTIAVGALNGLSNLEILSLYGNRITTIPSEALNGLNNLNILDVTSNYIFDINETDIIQNCPKLKVIKVNDNNLLCDRVYDIKMKLKSNDISINSFVVSMRNRNETTSTIDKIICLSESQWTSELIRFLTTANPMRNYHYHSMLLTLLGEMQQTKTDNVSTKKTGKNVNISAPSTSITQNNDSTVSCPKDELLPQMINQIQNTFNQSFQTHLKELKTTFLERIKPKHNELSQIIYNQEEQLKNVEKSIQQIDVLGDELTLKITGENEKFDKLNALRIYSSVVLMRNQMEIVLEEIKESQKHLTNLKNSLTSAN